jgi:hypothetical protein
MPALRLRPDLEEGLRALPGVQAVSVVTDAEAVPTEIHVLADPGKTAKQLVRDVQSMSMARFDLELDHRIVSIVQMGEQELHDGGLAIVPDAAPDAPGSTEEHGSRPVVVRIAVSSGMADTTATVVLRLDEQEFVGEATGMAAVTGRHRLVAAATIAAAAPLLGSACEIESAQVLSAGEREVALVVLTLDRPRQGAQVLTGSAAVRMPAEDAVARAVLDALNRHLAG